MPEKIKMFQICLCFYLRNLSRKLQSLTLSPMCHYWHMNLLSFRPSLTTHSIVSGSDQAQVKSNYGLHNAIRTFSTGTANTTWRCWSATSRGSNPWCTPTRWPAWSSSSRTWPGSGTFWTDALALAAGVNFVLSFNWGLSGLLLF